MNEKGIFVSTTVLTAKEIIETKHTNCEKQLQKTQLLLSELEEKHEQLGKIVLLLTCNKDEADGYNALYKQLQEEQEKNLETKAPAFSTPPEPAPAPPSPKSESKTSAGT